MTSDPLKDLKDRTFTHLYSLGEEIMNGVTHGIGAALSIAGLTVLVMLAVLYGNVTQVVSFSIYGASLVMLYVASTLYHSFQHPKVKRVFRIIDHASIFLLIAGTYTPFLLLGVQEAWGWAFLILIWGLAILGVGFKALFINRLQKLSVLMYILMGWLGVLMLKSLLHHIPVGGLVWLAAGGAAYTIGVIFYALKKIPYMHGVWHIFVLIGSLCHYLAVFLYLAPAH
ncbi:MAG TPA: hemolysin III family protein [Anaerolineae bacterium]|nr:hemolysin III family protein [Anaerolineae bacterium]HQH38699.1 hemolysin III family protein [Anaerolineae bacterium]